MSLFSINDEIMIFCVLALIGFLIFSSIIILCCGLLLLKWITSDPVPSHFQFPGRDGSGRDGSGKSQDGSGTGISSGPAEEALTEFEVSKTIFWWLSIRFDGWGTNAMFRVTFIFYWCQRSSNRPNTVCDAGDFKSANNVLAEATFGIKPPLSILW